MEAESSGERSPQDIQPPGWKSFKWRQHKAAKWLRSVLPAVL